MKTTQKLIFVILGIIILIFWEEANIGKGYVYLANQYEKEVLRRITVRRDGKRENVGIAVVMENRTDEMKYQMALDTVKCYAQYFQYELYILHISEQGEKIQGKCQQKDFMFRRHCVLSEKMQHLDSDWILFIDADMAVINPNHLIESYLPENSNTQIVFYNRIMNQEVMAGSYLVQNTAWSRRFLMFWAKYEQKLPNSFHGSDNGAIHSVILEFGFADVIQVQNQRISCEQKYWQTAKDYAGLSVYEVCVQKILKTLKSDEIRILEKGRFSWARDGWLTNSMWSSSDFIVHGWQQRRLDKRIFAMWHSPLVNDHAFNLQLCSTPEAYQNWRYKDTFIGSVVEVDRRIFDYIKNEEEEYNTISRTIH